MVYRQSISCLNGKSLYLCRKNVWGAQKGTYLEKLPVLLRGKDRRALSNL